jgi:hypothetical protein
MSKVDEETRLDQEARIALLQHFSSKSSNQATIIFTIALIFFAFVQTLQYVKGWSYWESTLYESLSLALIAFLVIRAIGRIHYWSKLAGSVLAVVPKSPEKVEEDIKEHHKEGKEKPTILGCIHSATGIDQDSNPFLAVGLLTNTVWAFFTFSLFTSIFG